MTKQVDQAEERDAYVDLMLRLATAVTRDLVAANIGPKNTYEFAQSLIRVVESEK